MIFILLLAIVAVYTLGFVFYVCECVNTYTELRQFWTEYCNERGIQLLINTYKTKTKIRIKSVFVSTNVDNNSQMG